MLYLIQFTGNFQVITESDSTLSFSLFKFTNTKLLQLLISIIALEYLRKFQHLLSHIKAGVYSKFNPHAHRSIKTWKYGTKTMAPSMVVEGNFWCKNVTKTTLEHTKITTKNLATYRNTDSHWWH